MSYRSTCTLGLISRILSRAEFSFLRPTSFVPCRICRCKIREIHRIAIDEAQPPHAGGRKIERDRRAEPARADAEHRRGLQPLLPLQRHLRHDQMPRVTGNLVIGEFNALEALGWNNGSGHWR